ncbi:MAG TPA: DegT/DnrJ/EryC1/StrS family aminotransferase [Longimicrobiales bacterium]
MATTSMIPVSRPSLSPEDIQSVTDAVASGWVSSLGPHLERFEREFAEFCGVKHSVSTSNGTVALHLALKVLNIGAGDEVIVPDLTFVATANAVMLAGATPVIADVRASDWCIDPDAVERLISPRTRAIMPVHLYGHPCDMAALRAIAARHGLAIIEDAAEAHGAEYDGCRVGSLGDCGTFSFYGNKIITTGEGGMLTTNSDAIAERARFLRDHGMSKELRYWHTEVAYNYRMTNLQAALGASQLARIAEFLEQRDRILESYRRQLEPAGITMNPVSATVRPVNWITCALVPDITREQRDLIIAGLKEDGIDTRPFFYPLTALPMYAREGNTVAHDLSARGINLPTYPGLEDADITHIADALLRLIQ